MTKDDRLTAIRAYLNQSADVLHATADACADDIARAVDLITECYRNGGKVLLCGNGGSAAQCQHLAAELVNVLSRDRPRPALAAIALTTDTSVLTAIANDSGFEQVFARQVEALGRPGDVLIAMSTSGSSPIVLRSLEQARQHGVSTLLMTGEKAGHAAELADVAVKVPCGNYQGVQEAHAATAHIICMQVEQALFEA